MKRLSSVLMVVLLAAMCSCGGPGTPAPGLDQLPDNSAPVLDQHLALPGLPASPPATRLAQDVTNYQFQDSDLICQSGGGITGADISLPASGLTWVVLGVEVADGQVPLMLHLTGTTTGTYIGVGDYDDLRWRWRGPVTTPEHMLLPLGDTVSDSGYFYVALICTAGDSADVQLSLDLDVEQWNVMVWIAGDNDLAADAVDDINEMESVGSSEYINLLVGFDIDPEYAPPTTGIDQVRFIKVVNNTNPGEIIVNGDPANQSFARDGYNSADPANLEAFLDWCDTNFTANRSLLILWNHGDGWLPGGSGGGAGAGAKRGTSGVLCDDSDGGGWMTDNPAIATALSGRHFDYLCFDACNMGQIEALYDYRGLADYIVASPMLEPNDGFPYDTWLAGWTASYPIPRQAIGAMLCSLYGYYYDTQFDDASLAMYDNQGIFDMLIYKLGQLADRVTTLGTAEQEAIGHAIQAAYKPWESDATADLGEFLVDYASQTTDEQVADLAVEAKAVYDELIYHFSKTINESGTGAGILLPDDFELEMYADDYRPLAFNQAVHWLEMFEATGVPGGTGDIPELTWQPGWRVVFEWDDVDAGCDVRLFIEGPFGNFSYPGDTSGGLDDSIEFSQDSMDSGDAVEWARLTDTAPSGEYLAALFYSHGGSETPEVLLINARLEDGMGALQYDFGTIPISLGEGDVAVGLLTYTAATDATWVPGDRVEITWGSSDADFNLELTDPTGQWGDPTWTYYLEGKVEFSQDSWESDVPEEWAKLLAGGVPGQYIINLWYCGYDGDPPESVPVTTKLYDSTNTLKQDLGTVIFDGEFDLFKGKTAAILEYVK